MRKDVLYCSDTYQFQSSSAQGSQSPTSDSCHTRIQLSEKVKVVENAQAPAKWPSASVPMFWSTIIELLDIGQIVDASPGCGTLAGAAMDADISYLGIVRSGQRLPVPPCSGLLASVQSRPGHPRKHSCLPDFGRVRCARCGRGSLETIAKP